MVQLFIDGGGFMWPILFIFIIGFVFVLERLYHLLKGLSSDEEFAQDIAETVTQSGIDSATAKCENAVGPVANLCISALGRAHLGTDEAEIILAAKKAFASLVKSPWIRRSMVERVFRQMLSRTWKKKTARQLSQLGHQVKLMPPIYVKPYVKRGKTDAGDAEAISEAVTRPTMRFVAVKSLDQQSMLALLRTRDLLIRQRTQLVNMIRGQLAEFGIVLAKGIQHVHKFTGQLLDGEALDIPPLAASVIVTLAEQLRDLQARIGGLDKDIRTWSRGNEVVKRLLTIPGIGIITASALVATVTDPHQFTSGRQFAAWLGLTPRANSSGGKERMGRISKMGDQYLRRLLVNGMTSLSQSVRRNPNSHPWAASRMRRKPDKLIAVAMANKTARIVWAVMTRNEIYRLPQTSSMKEAA